LTALGYKQPVTVNKAVTVDTAALDEVDEIQNSGAQDR